MELFTAESELITDGIWYAVLYVHVRTCVCVCVCVIYRIINNFIIIILIVIVLLRIQKEIRPKIARHKTCDVL